MKKSNEKTTPSIRSMANGSYSKKTTARQRDNNKTIVRLIRLIIDLPEEYQRNLLKELNDKNIEAIRKPSEEQRKRVENLRKHPRKMDLIAVDCSTHDSCFTNFIHDISDGGVYIKTNAPFYVGQEIQLDFSIPEAKNAISVSGEVVRVDPQGIGVKFTTAGVKH